MTSLSSAQRPVASSVSSQPATIGGQLGLARRLQRRHHLVQQRPGPLGRRARATSGPPSRRDRRRNRRTSRTAPDRCGSATSSRIRPAWRARSSSAPVSAASPQPRSGIGHACGNSRRAAPPWRCAAACRAGGRAARRTASRSAHAVGAMATGSAPGESEVGAARVVARTTRADGHVEPIAMDLPHRIGYRAAYRLLQVWWFLRRPQAHGAAVAVWQATRCSWCAPPTGPQLDLPGGGIERGEAPLGGGACASCARRPVSRRRPIELVAMRRVPLRGEPSPHHDAPVSRGAELAPCRPRADQREIVWAGFVPREQLARGRPRTLPRLATWPRSCSGAERHPPDVARIVAHRAVAREPAHVRRVEHRLGPPGRRARRRSASTRRWAAA